MKRSHQLTLLLLVALELCVARASAQATRDVKLEARAHFQAGMAAAQDGNLTAALSAFEAAYAAQPHFSVLYNIGRARAGLGRHVAAVTAFERYLSEGGSQIPDPRRAETRALLEASRLQIGALKIVAPPETRVWLDGTELTGEDLEHPIQLSLGIHGLIHSVRGSAPISQTVDIQPSTIAEISLTAPPVTQFASLLVRCDVPAVDIFVNGALRGRTPLMNALSVPVGHLQVRFFRLGYRPVEQRLEANKESPIAVDCNQHPLTRLPRGLEARLKLSVEPRDADVFVDGKRFTGVTLPSGLHELTINRHGFAPMTKQIVLSAQRTTEVAVTLKPTPSFEARMRAAPSHRRRTAYGLAGAGAALLAASAGLYIWNGNRYEDWRSKPEPDLGRALSIQRIDDLALGLLLGGAGLGAGGSWLLFSPAPEPPR